VADQDANEPAGDEIASPAPPWRVRIEFARPEHERAGRLFQLSCDMHDIAYCVLSVGVCGNHAECIRAGLQSMGHAGFESSPLAEIRSVPKYLNARQGGAFGENAGVGVSTSVIHDECIAEEEVPRRSRFSAAQIVHETEQGLAWMKRRNDNRNRH
jgi:hypothetical protein